MRLYEILGVDQKATTADIRRAYIAKARTMHPDKGGSAEDFAELQLSYELLTDPQRRAKYDASDGDDEGPADVSKVDIMVRMIMRTITTSAVRGPEVNGRRQRPMDPGFDDLLVRFKTTAGRAYDIATAKRTSIEGDIARADDILERFILKRKRSALPGPDLVGDALRAERRELKQELEDINLEIEANMRLRETLDLYAYKMAARIDAPDDQAYKRHDPGPLTRWRPFG